jgi:hypothetical protein
MSILDYTVRRNSRTVEFSNSSVEECYTNFDASDVHLDNLYVIIDDQVKKMETQNVITELPHPPPNKK